MKAHIKIDEKIDCCRDCPFMCVITGETKKTQMLCAWENEEVEDLDIIPSWCPFLEKEEEEG